MSSTEDMVKMDTAKIETEKEKVIQQAVDLLASLFVEAIIANMEKKREEKLSINEI